MELRQIEYRLKCLIDSGVSRKTGQTEFDSLVQKLSCVVGEQIGLSYFLEKIGANTDGGNGNTEYQRLRQFIKHSSQVKIATDKTKSLYQSVSRDRGVKKSVGRVLRFRQAKKIIKVEGKRGVLNKELSEILAERRLREELEHLIREAHKEYELNPLAYEAKRAIPEPLNELEIKVKEALEYYNTLILASNVLKDVRLVWNMTKEPREIPFTLDKTPLMALGEFRELIENLGDIVLDRPSKWIELAMKQGFKIDKCISVGREHSENLDLLSHNEFEDVFERELETTKES